MYTVKEVKRGDYAGWYVGLERSEDNKIYWVDVWINDKYKDVEADWNQYIFNLEYEDDMERRNVQANCDEFDMATSEAICYLEQNLEIVQDDSGNWYCNINERNWANE